MILILSVVFWSDMLGGVQWWEIPLPWHTPYCSIWRMEYEWISLGTLDAVIKCKSSWFKY